MVNKTCQHKLPLSINCDAYCSSKDIEECFTVIVNGLEDDMHESLNSLILSTSAKQPITFPPEMLINFETL